MNIPITNKTFWRALHSLSHPVTVFAVILLLINDHWLRYENPSWLTGKLGDFVWLIFAPILLALVLSWLIPRSNPSHEKLVGLLSFGLIGLWFATAKTIAPVHSATTQMLNALVGWQGGLRMDATDLLTLPGLLVGWWVWRGVPDKPSGVFSGTWVVLMLGLMGTVATSCLPPDSGVLAICQFGDEIHVNSVQQYFSTNDGKVWQLSHRSSGWNECLQAKSELRLSEDAFAMETSVGRFRFVLGEGIYISRDGQPERREIDLISHQHDIYARYHEGNNPGLLCGQPKFYAAGPFDAVFDETSGQLFVAMGLEGILKRSADGRWSWVTVGDYHHVELDSIPSVVSLLWVEIVWFLMALLLLPPTIATPASILGCFGMFSLGSAWTTWFLYRTYILQILEPIPVAIVLSVGITCNIQLAEHYLLHRRRKLAYFMVIVLAEGTGLLFLLPYLLWARRTVPSYGTASSFALLLLMACVISCRGYISWRFPARKKSKEDEDSENDDLLLNNDQLTESPDE